jgi:uncharacterized protein (TIGR02145 family)
MPRVRGIAAKSVRRVRARYACCVAVLLSTSANLAAQTEDVSAVEAVQVGSRIEIRYMLEYTTEVSIYLSEDGGVMWTPLTSCLSGDFGANVAAGRRTVVWDVLACRESLVGGSIRFKVRTGKPGPCSGAEVVRFNGYDYPTVAIGAQCWFKENLRSDNYRNGDAIPGNLTNARWTSTSSGAQAVYDNKPSSLATYGRLYNWYAVNDARGLCPSGFHVPTDEEWAELEGTLGGRSVAGAAMKTTSWGGTNSSGFSALPGGYRGDGYGNFYDQGNDGDWWSSSPNGPVAWSRSMFSGNSNVLRYNYGTRYGFSVRCVRD